MMRPTLHDALRQAAMPLNAFRLLLAFFVLFSHSFPLGGFGPDPLWLGVQSGTSFGSFAVGGFFVLSGLFVTQSAIDRPLNEFVVARLLRIMPALVFVLFITATVIGPIIYVATNSSLSGYWNLSNSGPVTYVLHNLFLPTGLQFGINNIFAATTPYGLETNASVINGSLWTLPIEIRCYLVALLVGILGKFFGYFRVSSVLLALTLFMLILSKSHSGIAMSILPEYFPMSFLELLTIFLIGSCIGSISKRIRLVPAAGIACLAVYIISSALGGMYFAIAGIGSLVYLAPYIAYLLRKFPLRIFKLDASYGVYLWAFPVQQVLSFAGLNRNWEIYLMLSVSLTLLIAVGSWFGVEKPFINLKQKYESRQNT